MVKRRIDTRIAAAVVGVVALAIMGLAGLFLYVTATSTPIHESADALPSSLGQVDEPASGATIARARAVVRTAIVEQNLPGLSVAVARHGRLVWAEGFGWADLDQRVPVTTDTRFRIGTASVLLTSAAVGRLVDAGTMTFDDPIQRWVPAYPTKPWPVTLRQVMAHTAGLPRDAGDEEPIHERCENVLDVLPRFAMADLRVEPGTAYRHSSYGWVLVSAAIEAAAGVRFNVAMRELVFEPFGLTDTRADALVGPSPTQATYYFPRFGANPRYGPQDTDREDFSCFAGASAFVSTPTDLVRFAAQFAEGGLVSRETVRALQAAQTLTSGSETGHGLGWETTQVTLSGRRVRGLGAEGALRDGPVMSLMVLPDDGVTIAALANISFADTASVVRGIAEAFLSVESVPPPPHR